MIAAKFFNSGRLIKPMAFIVFWLAFHNGLAQRNLNKLNNYVPIDQNLHTCGRVNNSEFEQLKALGFKSIISLSIESKSATAHEKEKAEALGLSFTHIPVIWTDPTLSSLEKFFRAMDENQNSKLLVHCQVNWTASAYVYLYRTLKLKEEPEAAEKDMLAVWDPRKYENWRNFIARAKERFK